MAVLLQVVLCSEEFQGLLAQLCPSIGNQDALNWPCAMLQILANSKDSSSITDSETDSMDLGSGTLLRFHTDFLGCSLLLSASAYAWTSSKERDHG